MRGEKLSFPMRYQHFALVTIRPGGTFPLDGLRYDRCMPWHETDTRRIEDTQNIFVSSRPDKPTQVIVTKYGCDTKAIWTNQFWHSFSDVEFREISAEQAHTLNREREKNPTELIRV
jgi:hypothetical protein